MPDFKSTLVKLYLVVGISVCLFFGTGAIAGWKMPSMDFGASGFGGGRSTGGFWGIGK
ncbi:MAG: hypothetical protein MK110_16530 [Fuerstiella sp.]|nr:hypothetical protein [Fuerstiella sp.]MCH2212910.1 hypothetical protein [Fuerstiella sp.]